LHVLGKGIVVVPSPARWTGPWLSATRVASLQRVANRPIVCHVLDALVAAGVSELALLLPADVAEEIRACVDADGPPGVAITPFVYTPEQSADALAEAAELLGEGPCILHRADGLLGQPLPSLADAPGDEPADALLLIREQEREAKRLRLVPQRLLRVPEDESAPVVPAGAAGILLLGAGMLALLADGREDAAGLDFAGIAARLAEDGRRVQMRFVNRWRHFAGDASDLLDMNRTMLDALDREQTPAATDGNRFEGPVVIHPSACVSSSVIIGPAIIGADALVADSYIGPHTSIAERVRIEGSELERSIVLADASVLHVGGRLVASIVGREARVFRDFSMPRALRLHVGDGDEVALC
jgi:glucose-1-phosphate thymidylyltransferase